MHFVQGTIAHMNEADAFLHVAGSLIKAADLPAHLFRNGKASRVVRGAINAVAGA